MRMKKSMKEPIIWSDNMISVFIDCWKNKNNEIREAKRHLHIFRDMVDCLKLYNIEMSPAEVHTKIENLTSQHAAEKIKLNSFEDVPSGWKWFNAVNDILEKYTEDTVLHQADDELDLIAQVECYLQKTEVPSTSCPSEQRIDINAPSPRKSRKLCEIQGDLLDEIKNANETSKSFLDELKKQTVLLGKIQQCNEQQIEISRQNFEFQKTVLDFVKNKNRKNFTQLGGIEKNYIFVFS